MCWFEFSIYKSFTAVQREKVTTRGGYRATQPEAIYLILHREGLLNHQLQLQFQATGRSQDLEISLDNLRNKTTSLLDLRCGNGYLRQPECDKEIL